MTGAKVRIGSDVALYQEKAPYKPSGESIHGALELNQAGDLVRCHECGEWFNHLSWHVWRAHGMKTRAYKIKHGLPIKAALCNEVIRKRLIDAGFAELEKRGPEMAARLVASRANKVLPRGADEAIKRPYYALRNRRGRCPAQLLEAIRELGEHLNRPVRESDLLKAKIYSQDLEYLFGQPWREVVALAGLEARPAKRRYGAKQLVEMLRDFYVRFQRLPSQSDYSRGLLPSRDAYARCFGSMDRAYFIAGLERVASERRFKYSPEALEAIMRAWIERTGAMPTNERWASGAPGVLPTWKTFARYIPDMVEFGERMRRYAASFRVRESAA